MNRRAYQRALASFPWFIQDLPNPHLGSIKSVNFRWPWLPSPCCSPPKRWFGSSKTLSSTCSITCSSQLPYHPNHPSSDCLTGRVSIFIWLPICFSPGHGKAVSSPPYWSTFSRLFWPFFFLQWGSIRHFAHLLLLSSLRYLLPLMLWSLMWLWYPLFFQLP